MGPLASLAQHEKYEAYLRVGAADGRRLETPTHGCAPAAATSSVPRCSPASGRSTGSPRKRSSHRSSPSSASASYDEAVDVVNGTSYGLSAGVVTSSIDTALRFARDVEAGVVKVNQPTTGMAMNAPFGGMRRSSTQTFKEQAGPSMMQFYTREKTVYFTSEDDS